MKLIAVVICALIIIASLGIYIEAKHNGWNNPHKPPVNPPPPPPPPPSTYYSFEGFGTYTRGAYSGSKAPAIYSVTNLNNSGIGSLRYGMEAAYPRIIVFEISGTITLTSYIWVDNPYLTVAGQTAPSPGITIKGAGFWIASHNIIVQHMRIRSGSPINTTNCNWWDSFDIEEGAYNIVADHCSFSWAVDETIGIGWEGAKNITLQWCIISESLDCNCHPEGCHSMGLLAGPKSTDISIHHCLFAHNGDRNPTIGSIGRVEVINNVIYNYRWDATKFEHYTGYGAQFGNIIGNYYKYGSNTLNDYGGINLGDTSLPSMFYVYDNYDSKFRTLDTQDQWACVYGNRNMRSNNSVFMGTGISTSSPLGAYVSVLSNSGARPNNRDSVDIRVINDVKNKTGRIINSPSDVGGWPNLAINIRQFIIPTNPHNDDNGNGLTNLEELLINKSMELMNQ